MIVARDDFSGWVEAKPLVNLSAVAVVAFLRDSWVSRYGAIKTVTVDNGTEFKGEFLNAVRRLGAEARTTTPYYPEGNGMVERGH